MVIVWPGEHYISGALQAQSFSAYSLQAQLMRGEFPETLCIEQGVVLSCRFAEWKVRWTSLLTQIKLMRTNTNSYLQGGSLLTLRKRCEVLYETEGSRKSCDFFKSNIKLRKEVASVLGKGQIMTE